MTCEIVGTERALYVAWGAPETNDIDQIAEHLKRRAGPSKESVFYVTRVPIGAPAPTETVRRYLNHRMAAMIEYCAAYHVILEGDGFTAAMKRGVLVSLFQLTQKRGIFNVHATIDDFRRKVPTVWRSEVERLLSLAAERDLLVDVIPCERFQEDSGSFRVRGAHSKKAKSKDVA